MKPETGSVPRNSVWQAIWRAIQAGQSEVIYKPGIPAAVYSELLAGDWDVTWSYPQSYFIIRF